MARAPVQIVLEPNRFVGLRPTRRGGGANREFFSENDEAFRQHRDRLHFAMNSIAGDLRASAFGGVAYAKVQLQRSALAKSHRPTDALFTPQRAPTLGALELGQLVVEVTPESLTEIATVVRRAEDSTRFVEDKKTGKRREQPSRSRSEVGAVTDFELWGAGDKRTFSARDAVEWLRDPLTGGRYRIELFRPLPERSD